MFAAFRTAKQRGWTDAQTTPNALNRSTPPQGGQVLPRGKRSGPGPKDPQSKSYSHADQRHPVRPDIGIQPEYEARAPRKPPKSYRYDPSLDPALSWDGNPAREQGEHLIARIQEQARIAADPAAALQARTDALVRLRGAADELAAMSRAFLNWSGKDGGPQLSVPTLPLFVHERLSTQAVLESVRGMKRTKVQALSLFADEGLDIDDRIFGAYEHAAPWTNRLILGDSLAVMNSLLDYEGLGGKVQMIYMDPPYGVKFGSNFQPFVRKREVKHGADDDLTREPEMVQAYRDTWELGLHSYLTYMRDRLTLARDLLHPSGSVFVQISDDNLHHVTELLDEVFGANARVARITFVKTTGSTQEFMATVADSLLWYAKDRDLLKYRQLYLQKIPGAEGGTPYSRVELEDGTRRAMTSPERVNPSVVPDRARIYSLDNLTSQSMGREKGEGAAAWFPVELDGKTYRPNMQSRWKTNEAGMERLKASRRLDATESRLGYVRYLDDFPFYPLNNVWDDVGASFMSDKLYVVQTTTSVVGRCLQMTTDPGDLVLDPTCGSGTTAYVAEQWGRRWITIDTSHVPLALARQRLLTATFPWYQLKDPSRGPAGGFVYKRRQDSRGREVGGIVPHVTLKSIAQQQEPEHETLVDRPEVESGIVRVTGAFTVEAVIPPALRADGIADGEPEEGGAAEQKASYSSEDGAARLMEALRRSETLHVPGAEPVAFRNVRGLTRGLALQAEAETGPADHPQRVAFAFGPEHAPVTQGLLMEAVREAHLAGYSRLFLVGYAVEDAATKLLHHSPSPLPLPTAYVQASMDLQMGDLLKTSRASQVFAAIGAPDVRLLRLKEGRNGEPAYRMQLRGLDVFDPVTMDCEHRRGEDVPAWMLDTDYDELVFRASQVFFPRTSAWDSLRRHLRGVYDDTVWEHLAGTTSEPFSAGDHKRVAVKVIDDRGNELLVTRLLAEAEAEA